MLFFNVKRKRPVEKTYTAKRTEDILEPMNLDALSAYAKRIENQKQHVDLLTRMFNGSFSTEVANTPVTERKASNS